jgi:hypothetical protein
MSWRLSPSHCKMYARKERSELTQRQKVSTTYINSAKAVSLILSKSAAIVTSCFTPLPKARPRKTPTINVLACFISKPRSPWSTLPANPPICGFHHDCPFFILLSKFCNKSFTQKPSNDLFVFSSFFPAITVLPHFYVWCSILSEHANMIQRSVWL